MKEFVVSERSQSDFLGAGVDLHSCRFDARDYHDELFERFGISRPETLARARDKRKSEYLAGRICAARLLEKFGYPNFFLKSGDGGRPVWPESVRGSISHTEHLAIAIATTRPEISGVGVDVETVVDASGKDAIESQVTIDRERHLINQLPESEHLLLTLVFSIKESFFKAVYPHVEQHFGFKSVEVVSIDLINGSFQICLTHNLNSTFQRGRICSGSFQRISQHLLTLTTISNSDN